MRSVWIVALLGGCSERALYLPEASLDLAESADLAVTHDLAQQPDPPEHSDLAQQPDLPQHSDLAQQPDLAQPSLWKQSITGTTARFRGVWGASASDLWIVGDEDYHGAGSPIVWSWVSYLKSWAVWGTSSHDNWVLAPILGSPTGATVANAGSGAPPDNWYWNGTASATGPGLRGIWGFSKYDVWTVGDRGTILHNGFNLLQFSTVSSDDGPDQLPATGGCRQLLGVWGTSSSNLWVVGANETIVHGRGTPIAWSLARHDDSDRSPCPSPLPIPTDAPLPRDLRAVWGSSASDLWAVGHDGLILHGDGSTWSVVPSGSTAFLMSVWGSSASDVWAVGSGGTILHGSGSPVTWQVSPSGTTADLTGVFGFSSSDVWVVGAAGTVLHFGG